MLHNNSTMHLRSPRVASATMLNPRLTPHLANTQGKATVPICNLHTRSNFLAIEERDKTIRKQLIHHKIRCLQVKQAKRKRVYQDKKHYTVTALRTTSRRSSFRVSVKVERSARRSDQPLKKTDLPLGQAKFLRFHQDKLHQDLELSTVRNKNHLWDSLKTLT